MQGKSTKRQKEQARATQRQEKMARKEERKREKAERPAGNPGEDPDLAGIVPGPQPVTELP
jgi:hypothetical protein